MLIQFTNSAEQHKGNKLYINKDHIVAVFEAASEEGGSLKTIIYGGPQGTSWNVEESMGKVVSLINKGSQYD